MSSLILSKMMASKCDSNSFLGGVTPFIANSRYKLFCATSIMSGASAKSNLILKLALSSNNLSLSPFLSGHRLCNKDAFAKKAPIVQRIAAEANTPGSQDPKMFEKLTSGIKVDDLAAAIKTTQRLKIVIYFATWWSLNVVFNIYNKKVLNVYPFPWLTSTLSLAAGSTIMLVSWAFKIVEPPEVDCDFWKNLAPVALAHTIGHVAATISMSKVAVSFTHIIKSSEPAFTVIIQKLVFGQNFPCAVYLSLLPIIGGCGLAAATELNFNTIGLNSPTMVASYEYAIDSCYALIRCFGYSRMLSFTCKLLDYLPTRMNGLCHCWWTGFLGAMISNIAFVFRNIFSKKGMMSKGKNVGGINYYACLSMMSLVFLVPFAIAVEGPKAWCIGWRAAKLEYGNKLLWWIVVQSVFYHLYNQVSYMSLNEISPLTFSIGNTMKRVTVIGSSILIFHTPILPINVVGAVIAIFGTFLYSQVNQ